MCRYTSKFDGTFDAVYPPALVTPEINQLVDIYLKRTSFIEWPKYSKFPLVAAHLDSCPQKQATITPLPVGSNTPWIGYLPFGSPTNPSSKTNMCSLLWTPTTAWCASKANPLQKFIAHWEYNRSDPKGFYLGGGLFEPIVADSAYGYNINNACDGLCNSNALGTAYVVGWRYEMAVSSLNVCVMIKSCCHMCASKMMLDVPTGIRFNLHHSIFISLHQQSKCTVTSPPKYAKND